MEYRSTNPDGRYVHFGGAVVAGVESGSGIELNPNSSGVAPIIQPVGDETAKNLLIKGKGTGGVIVGNSSGTALKEIRGFTVHFTPPELSTGAAGAVASTHTVAGLSTGTVLMFTPVNPMSELITVRAACSTANELKLIFGNLTASTIGTGLSTNHGTLLQFSF